jgi:hypothetical protein
MFWNEWRPGSTSIDEALSRYISFIHARDLILDHFFDFVDGCRFELKLKFRTEQRISNELSDLQEKLEQLAAALGTKPSSVTALLVRQTFHKARAGNTPLMKWLRGLSTNERVLIIGVLWESKTLVTIFDGLDALRIEDAFQDSEEWRAVVHIVQNRSALSSPDALREIGVAEHAIALS